MSDGRDIWKRHPEKIIFSKHLFFSSIYIKHFKFYLKNILGIINDELSDSDVIESVDSNKAESAKNVYGVFPNVSHVFKMSFRGNVCLNLLT